MDQKGGGDDTQNQDDLRRIAMMAEDLLLVGQKADSSEGAWTPRRTPTVKESAVRIVDRTEVELMTIAVCLVEELR